MHGVAQATAAVTILNALPLGIGSALGVGLGTRAGVSLGGGEGPLSTVRFRPSEAATPVVRAALYLASRAYLPAGTVPTDVEITSEIPVAKGLKSSSAVASAVAWAVGRAAGRSPTPEEVARLSAQAGRDSGASATGAFDDALAGVRPGIVVTDNRSDTVLASHPVPADLEVVLWIPPGTHPPAPSLTVALAARSDLAREAAELAVQGEWARAMEINSELVEGALRYDYAPLRAECRRRGAVSSGVSGLGPAFAALVPGPHARSVVEGLPGGAEVRTVSPTRPSVELSEGRP